MKKTTVALAALALTSLPVAAAQPAAELLIRHVTVVDVERGRTIPDQAIVTAANEILAVGADAAIAKSWQAAQTVDGSGRYVIPGLWDMHVHFGGGAEVIEENKALLPLYVAHGITTVRDASGDLATEVLAWRGEIARGTLFGPTLLSSGPKIEGIKPIWKGTLETGTETDVDAAIAKLKALNVDFVKITDSTLKPELFLYAVRKARAAGLRTSGHIPMALTVRQAVDAGLSSIEHLDYAFDAGAKDEAAIAADFAAGRIDRTEASRRLDAGFDRTTALEMYRYLARKKVFVTPTLNGSRIIAWLDRDTHANDEYLQYIGPKLRKTYEWRVQRAAQADAAAVAFRHAHVDRMAAILPLLQEAGVTIMAGTDAGFLNSFNYPGIGLHDELSLYVEKGMTPAQALASATRAGPAWFDKLDRYGSLAKGKAADLVLLDRNPLQDIQATRSIHAVIMRGKLYDRAALDGMLADARTKVAAWNGAEQGSTAATVPFKLGTFEKDGRSFVGVVVRDSIVIDIAAANGGTPHDMKELIAQYDQGLRQKIVELAANPNAHTFALKDLKVLPPIMYPTTMLNTAVNYVEHGKEMAGVAAVAPAAGNEPGKALPGTKSAPGIWERRADDQRWNPYMFLKSPAAVIADGESVRLPVGRTQIDWECELAVVIGKPAARVSSGDAANYIFGYTLENDVSDRGGRGDSRSGSDWLVGKSHDTFAPLGPFIVPREFVADPRNLAIRFTLNGQLMQQGSTAAMIHDVFEQVQYASNIMTLRPGDVLATGTPPGVGSGRKPPIFLKAGDKMECTYEGVGTLRNDVRAPSPP